MEIDRHLNESQNKLAFEADSDINEFIIPTENKNSIDMNLNFAHRLAKSQEIETCRIFIDHCYARPWNWRPDNFFLRPTKTLFMSKPPSQKIDEEIDIETNDEETPLIYDKAKAKHLMDECERHAALARVEEGNENWEETILRTNWSTTQDGLFNGMVDILNSDHLARLAITGTHNEIISRRTIIDKSVQRVRRLFGTISWDTKLTQWLHQLLIDNLSTQYLSAYLDILQTLKSKLPNFVDKLMTGHSSTKLSILSYETLFPLLKRPWDPVASSLMQDKPKKLPGNPIILIVPGAPSTSKRIQKYITLLSNLATIVTVSTNLGNSWNKMTMTNYVDQLCVLVRLKIQDIKADYPGRHIVLVGFNSGSTIALQIAQVEQILCVICLGFSILTAEGRRGEPDDNLMELRCPILFVIGQCSNTSLQEDMEDLRERMRVETGLIIVGSADDYLRVNKKKKRFEGITQSVIDRCIADEVGEFISGIILSPYPPQIRQSPTNDGGVVKKVKTERKRYNSSSLESESPSPTPRITRPGQNNSPTNFGRPPGSKSKTKLESKWATQGIPSQSPNNSPSNFHTPDTSSNDSSLPDKTTQNTDPPIKKLKTLKPTVNTSEKQSTTSNISPLKSQINTVKLATYSAQNRSLATLLQEEIHKSNANSQTKPSSSGIKVLENVKLNPNNTKVFTNTNKSIDLSKMTFINSTNSSSVSNLILLPDGKLKKLSNTKEGHFITSKRQLLGNKTPKTVKKISYIPQTSTDNLPPPTNLTTQDIMDLPIIFADDNQVLDTTSTTTTTTTKQVDEIKTEVPKVSAQTPQPPQPSKIISTSNGNKFLLVNKPQSTLGSLSSNLKISNNIKKTSSINTTKPSVKCTKIIVSKKQSTEDGKTASPNIISKIGNISSEIAVKKVSSAPTTTTTTTVEKPSTSTTDNSFMLLDYENDIKASFIPNKPLDSSKSLTGIGKSIDMKNITIITGKTSEILKSDVLTKFATLKRTASNAGIKETSDDNAKNIKLDNTD